MTATEGLFALHSKGFDEYYLTKIFSVEPWSKSQYEACSDKRSITAVDDTLGEHNLGNKDYPVSDYRLYFGGT